MHRLWKDEKSNRRNMTPKQRFKKGEITFREMLLETGRGAVALTKNQIQENKYLAIVKRSRKWALLKARIDGFDVDNSSYLDGDQDEGSRIDNMKGYSEKL